MDTAKAGELKAGMLHLCNLFTDGQFFVTHIISMN